MSKDFIRLHLTKSDIRKKVLQQLSYMLDSIGKNINDYHLINDTINLSDEDKFMEEINEEFNIVVYEQDISTISKLNKDKKYAYDLILEKVFSNQQASFLLEELEKHI